MNTEITTAVAKCANPEIKKALEKYMGDNNFTLKKVGNKLGCSESMISLYFSTKPVGDLVSFEESVIDMIAADSRKQELESAFFETYAAEQCFTLFDLIRSANDVGIIYGSPGIGKTEASKQYAKLNPTCIRIEIPEWKANRWGVANLLYAQFDNRKKKEKEGKCEFLARKLHHSDRLIIVDNAQRVPLSGLRWLMDFNDATRTPFALVGNPEKIMLRLQTDDALSSRVGLCKSISADIKDAEVKRWLFAAADRMVQMMWPVAFSDIRKLAHESVLQIGHLRRLKKQISHAIRLTESPAWRKSNDAAFVYARSLLVNMGGE